MERPELLRYLAAQIAAVSVDHPVRVGIDGVDAAGKSTLADDLVPALSGLTNRCIIRASVDDFLNPKAIRYGRGMSGETYFRDTFNYSAVIGELLIPLGPSGKRSYRRTVFDLRTDTVVHAPVEHAPDDAILLFDGVFLHRSEIRKYWDFSIFVEADFERTVKRAQQRDAARFGAPSDVRRRYEQRYVPGQQLYLSGADPKRLANIVVDNNDPAHPTILFERSSAFRISSDLNP